MPAWLSGALVLGEIGWLLWLERRRPLRRAVEAKLRRNARNLGVAAASAVALQLTERPVIAFLAARALTGIDGEFSAVFRCRSGSRFLLRFS